MMMNKKAWPGAETLKIDPYTSSLSGTSRELMKTTSRQKKVLRYGNHVLTARNIIGYDKALWRIISVIWRWKAGLSWGNYMADPKYNWLILKMLFTSQNSMRLTWTGRITAGSKHQQLNGEDNFQPWELQAMDRANTVEHYSSWPAHLRRNWLKTKKIADYAYQYGIKTMMHCAGSPVGVIANVHTAATIKEFIWLEIINLKCPGWMIWWPVFQNQLSGTESSRYPSTPDLDWICWWVAEKYLREPKYLAYKSGLFNPTPEFDKPMTMMKAKQKGLIGDYHQTGGPWWHINDHGVYGKAQTGMRTDWLRVADLWLRIFNSEIRIRNPKYYNAMKQNKFRKARWLQNPEIIRHLKCSVLFSDIVYIIQSLCLVSVPAPVIIIGKGSVQWVYNIRGILQASFWSRRWFIIHYKGASRYGYLVVEPGGKSNIVKFEDENRYFLSMKERVFLHMAPRPSP